MIEELSEYLTRKGWSNDIAGDADDAYYHARGTLDAAAKLASESVRWADDGDHDYSEELRRDIVQWQFDVNEREKLP